MSAQNRIILFCDDTRRSGAGGLVIFWLVGVAFLYCRWASLEASWLWVLGFCYCASFYGYLMSFRRRRKVTLLGDELIWNTTHLSAKPVSVCVGDIRVYRVEIAGNDGPLFKGAVILSSDACCDIGELGMEDHKRIYRALRVIEPAVEWQEIE